MGNDKGVKRKNGDGNWGKRTINGTQYLYFRKQYPDMKSLKYFYGKTEKEINQKRKEFESDLRDKKIILNKKDIPKVAFGDFCLNYLNKEASNTIKPTTKEGYLWYINHCIKGYDLGKVPMASLNEECFKTHVEDLKKRYSRATIKKAFVIISLVLDYAVDKKYVTENFTNKIKTPTEENVKVKTKEVKFLEYEDMIKLYDEAYRTCTEENPVPGIKVGEPIYGINSKIVALITFTGMRISECLGLKWENVDFEHEQISVKTNLVEVKNDVTNKREKLEQTPKTEKGIRIIPMCEQSKYILEDLFESKKDDEVFVFNNKNGKQPGARNVTRTLNSMQVRANCKVKKCGLHPLRHSFGSYLILSGADIKVVSEILGHKDVAFTYKTYIHIINKQKMSAISLMNKKPDDDKKDDEPIQTDTLKILRYNGYGISEIEKGMLGYIKDMQIVKVNFTDTIKIDDDVEISGKDIYNSYYS
jgi:integrase